MFEKFKTALLGGFAIVLAILALYIKSLKQAALEVELKALNKEEKRLGNEALKHKNNANSSLVRARAVRERMRARARDLQQK